MKPSSIFFLLFVCIICFNSCNNEPLAKYKKWHKISLSFEGEELQEDEKTFLNYRLQVYFTHQASGKTYNVPGFYAADGKASETSADKGKIWKVNFTPDELGEWTYTASFRKGDSIAISLDSLAGESAGFFDGKTGRFEVADGGLDTKSKDFRAKGQLRYVGEHYLQHAESKEFFIKGGAGSPENLLAYQDFDGTFDNGGTHYPALGKNQLHKYHPHKNDWLEGDTLWKDSLGTELIGAVNYISNKGINAVYIVTMNVAGDGNDTWPWAGPEKRAVFDVSKLAQWEIVFDHMDRKGTLKDILFTETENENLFEELDGGTFSFTRKLYYREMIARFGHNLGIVWDLGEENGHEDSPETGKEPFRKPNTDEQRELFCEFIRKTDPYKHPIVVHNWPGDEEKIYAPLLGSENFEGVSLQEDSNYYEEVLKWVNKSDSAGRKWIAAVDEPLGWEFGLRPDSDDPEHDIPRTKVLWPTLMAGGMGVDWYFGWQNNAPTSDLSNEDWRTRNNMWEQTKIAIDFFQNHLPFSEMKAVDGFSDKSNMHVFAKENEVYVVYLKTPEEVKLNLGNSGKNFSVKWFNPKTGGDLQNGSIAEVKSGKDVSIGMPPVGRDKDWVCIVTVIK